MTDMHLESDEKRSVMICLYVARHPSNTDMSSPSLQLLSQRGESKENENHASLSRRQAGSTHTAEIEDCSFLLSIFPTWRSNNNTIDISLSPVIRVTIK